MIPARTLHVTASVRQPSNPFSAHTFIPRCAVCGDLGKAMSGDEAQTERTTHEAEVSHGVVIEG